MKNNSEILIYANADGEISLDVRLEDESVWLTQAHMAELFGKSKKTMSEHIQNIFKEGELDEQWLSGNSEQPLVTALWKAKPKAKRLITTIWT